MERKSHVASCQQSSGKSSSPTSLVRTVQTTLLENEDLRCTLATISITDYATDSVLEKLPGQKKDLEEDNDSYGGDDERVCCNERTT